MVRGANAAAAAPAKSDWPCRCSAPGPSRTESRVRASVSETGRDAGGGNGAVSSHWGRRFQIINPSVAAVAPGRPSACKTNGAHGQPACPMRAARPAACSFSDRVRPAASRWSSLWARLGRHATSASRRPGQSRSRTWANPRGVGEACLPGSTKAKSSNRSRHGRLCRPRRRKVAGRCTTRGLDRCCSACAASSTAKTLISPSAVSMAARPCPATSAGKSGGMYGTRFHNADPRWRETVPLFGSSGSPSLPASVRLSSLDTRPVQFPRVLV